MRINRILFLPIIILLITCGQKQQKSESNVDDQVKINNLDYKNIISDFALNYSPKGSSALDSIPEDIIRGFIELRKVDQTAHEKYVTLVFTKLYAEHLRCCHQGYVIATRLNNDFDTDNISMISEFAYMSKYLEKDSLPEMWTSGIIEIWLTENPDLLEFEQTRKYKQVIDSISNKIENGDYWN